MIRFEIQVLIAILLDMFVGDPVYGSHPVRLIGNLIKYLESRLLNENNSSVSKVINGAFLWLITVFTVCAISSILLWLGYCISPLTGDIISIVIIYFCITAQDLVVHGIRVYNALNENNMEKAKRAVGMLITRDTEKMEKRDIIRAAVESISENTVDGLTAPVFFAVLFGPVGAVIYRVINTLDSMVGYKNKKYFYFGKFSARIDDLVNYVPARISAGCMVISSMLFFYDPVSALKILFKDSGKSPSPNAGLCESVAAGALNIRLGGPGIYFGKKVNKPFIGESNNKLMDKHILMTIYLVISCYLINTGIMFYIRYALLTILN